MKEKFELTMGEDDKIEYLGINSLSQVLLSARKHQEKSQHYKPVSFPYMM